MVPRQKSYIAPISSALDIKIDQYLFLRSVPHVTCRATSKNNSRVTKSPNSHQHEANLKTLIAARYQRIDKDVQSCLQLAISQHIKQNNLKSYTAGREQGQKKTGVPSIESHINTSLTSEPIALKTFGTKKKFPRMCHGSKAEKYHSWSEKAINIKSTHWAI